MFNNKYSKTLTVVLIMVIILIIGLLIFFGIRVYRKYYIKQAATDAVDEFKDMLNETSEEPEQENNVILNDVGPSVDLNSLYQDNQPTDDNDDDESGTGVTHMGYDVIGYIEIPETDVEYPIIPDYQGSINALNVGIVKLYPGNDSLNKPGNTVLAGHNYRDGSFFSNNKRLEEGDKIYITSVDGEKVEYEIYKKYETSTSDSSYMNRDTEGRREISLTTCTDDTSARLIIWAKEV